ncbi:MAG: hypothetical protein GWP91_02845 [Rhodobacterales bacterium]|nr:hypothetical protein [Rhodobacterales bacterium]
MQITALGHSCILLAFQNEKTVECTRILVDPWLSDHATGDAMGRFPRLRFQMADLGPIHAVYLSHAHSDHLDPYTLVRLWDELDSPPTLLLPVSLSFLIPLFRKHLRDPDVLVLHAHQPTTFRGLGVLGFFDVGVNPTNEDDVMILVVTNGSERVLVEADARLSLELPNFRAYVNSLMRGRGIESAVYLTTENELSGPMESRICATTEDRAYVLEHATVEMFEAVEQLYAPADDPDDLWQGEHVLRLVHGQGLTAPHELDAQWQRILFPVTLDDRVQAERAVSERNGCKHVIDSFTVGAVHTIAAGRIQSRAPMPGLVMLDDDQDRAFDPGLDFFPEPPCAPLRCDKRNDSDQRERILALLNERFLPFLHGLGRPPVLHLLASYEGTYRVRVFFGSQATATALDYVLSFHGRGFVEVEAGETEAQEAYWANDLTDFLDGRCDEFSPFCRTQFPVEEVRLWACLATPLLNSDLVAKRVGLHFERAQNGDTPGSYVLKLYASE